MEYLKQTDIARLTRFFQVTSVPSDLSAFAERTLPAINELVGGDVICHAEADPASGRVFSQTTYASGGDAPLPPGSLETKLLSHPIFQYWALCGESAAARTSDFVTRRQWHRSALYQNVYRHWRCEDSLAIGLPAPPGLVACFCIERGKTFTDRERALLDVVRPHLANAYRNAEAFSLMNAASQTSETESFLLDGNGGVVMASEGAWDLVEHYFPGHEAGPAGLPEALERWVNQQYLRAARNAGAEPLASPLEVNSRNGGQLVVNLVQKPWPREQSLLVLREQGRGGLGRAARRFGLTVREQEVIEAAIRGLDSEAIANDLCISRRTVDKHFENIYSKLGVESRSAAVACVLKSR